MDGRNCTGRTISLLNDSSHAAPATAKYQLPPLVAHSRSPSSCASTPSLAPETPQLACNYSSDSHAFSTPSPITPSYASFDAPAHLGPSQQSHQQYSLPATTSYSKMDPLAPSMYPPPPDASATVPYPASLHMQPHLPQQQPQPQAAPPTVINQQAFGRTSDSPASEPSRVSAVSTASNAKAQPKKNQYPCPMAKAFGCNDYFTTSGHAARHAKKHTGKKDAFCPECNKAFTRKDNMEQHRRTHQNGRGASRTSTDDSKVKKTTKQPAKKAPKADAQFEAAVEQELAGQAAEQMAVQQAIPSPNDASLIMPPITQPYFMSVMDNGPIPSLPIPMPDIANMRPPLHRASLVNSLEYVPPVAPMADPDMPYSYPSPNLSNGLDSLVLAADAHRRIAKEESSSRSPPDTTPSDESP